MLKSIEKLLDCCSDTKVGNHSSEYLYSVCFYKYFGTTICEVDYDRKEFKLPYKGYYSDSASTKRAVNDYKRYFNGLGFTLVG